MQDRTLFQSMNSHGFPEQQEQVKCPRCDSTNTKFCYYNNYNLSQPRHFCKSCRRYWTKGGTLRNIPVGGGSRKNTKRSSTNTKRSSTTPSSSSNSPSVSSAIGSTDPISGSFSSLMASSSAENLRNGSRLKMAGSGEFGANASSVERVVDPGPEMQSNGDLSRWNSNNEWSNLAMYKAGSRFQ